MNRIAFCVLATCIFPASGCRDFEPETAAPNADFETRQKWGQRKFGNYLPIVEQWVRSSPLITDSIGSVQEIAPVGAPNQRIYGFGDGGFAKMKLEVIGKRGTGILVLPSVSISNLDHSFFSFDEEASWTTAGRKDIIAASGRGYLTEFEIESAYNELINFSTDQDVDIFLFYWDQFQQKIVRTFPRHQSPGRTKTIPLQGLRDIYREPLLQHKADLHSSWGRQDDAAEAYRELATSAMDRAYDGLRAEERNEEQVADALNLAFDSLCKANQLGADCRETHRLARRRIELNHWFKSGSQKVASSKRPGIFFEAAVRESKSLPYIQRNLGAFKAIQNPQFHSGLYVNNKNRYAAHIHLELHGQKAQGSLDFRFRENEKELPPLDLFAEQPRMPDYPLKFKSPRWESSEGEKVKLSAKTGEPL